MKTHRPKSEQRSEARDDLKSIKDYLRRPLVQPEPFDYAARAQQVQEAQRLNALASQLRFRPPANPQIWDLHQATAKRFWEAMDAAYPLHFDEDCLKLRVGDTSGLETAIRFLEADPFFHRSGYTKVSVIRAIKPPMLKSGDIERLQNVVLSVVDRRHDQDFQAFCKLARKVDGPELREQLTRRLDSGDADIRRRARWVLEALAQKDRQKPRVETRGAE